MLESEARPLSEPSPVYKKLLLALLLLLNHSLMIGVTEAAHIPDEEHPYGHTVDYDHPDEPGVHPADDDHEQHHKHGMHVHLGSALPSSLHFEFPRPAEQPATAYNSLPQGITYSPPVPPPDR